jgi:hypothetical protein
MDESFRLGCIARAEEFARELGRDQKGCLEEPAAKAGTVFCVQFSSLKAAAPS